jgi:hypothetical protein
MKRGMNVCDKGGGNYVERRRDSKRNLGKLFGEKINNS